MIDIYETVIQNERYDDKTRSNVVEDFFDDIVRFQSNKVAPPFPQISNASEEALLRILEVADYALTLDFLPQETRDLVYEKRAEVIDRLEEFGHDSEWLRAEGPKTEVIEQVVVELPAQSTDSDLETPEPEGELLNPMERMDSYTEEMRQRDLKRLIIWFGVFILIIASIFVLYLLLKKKSGQE